MTNPFSINEYVDCKNNKQQWWIARVVKIDGDFVKLRFDGATSDKDIVAHICLYPKLMSLGS